MILKKGWRKYQVTLKSGEETQNSKACIKILIAGRVCPGKKEEGYAEVDFRKKRNLILEPQIKA